MAVQSQDRKTGAVVSVRGLGKTFGDKVAFADVSFEIRHGEVFGFLGPNGAGKATTVRTFGTLIEPTSGPAGPNQRWCRSGRTSADDLHVGQIAAMAAQLNSSPAVAGRAVVSARTEADGDRPGLPWLIFGTGEVPVEYPADRVAGQVLQDRIDDELVRTGYPGPAGY
jgi:energy-coupling factor transporter ATP-binding protein EcfA2